jgi:hypothetical protein
VGPAEAPALELVPQGWLHTGLLASAFQGALRSPTFVLDQPFVHVLVAGKGARANLVIDSFHLIRDPIYGGLKRGIDREAPHWLTFDASAWQGRTAYVELLDQSVEDLAGPGGDGRGGFVAAGALHLSAGAAAPGPAPTFRRWQPPADSPRAERLRALAAEHRAAGDAVPDPVQVPAMADGTGRDGYVFVRGSPRQRGEPAPRRFLEAIAGARQEPMGAGSGRLELARRVLSPANPFVARVWVNRLWHHAFGRGLVPTPDDFGALGQPPSHPGLLDWLASRLRAQGWSTKAMLRELVTSSAYRMSSAPRDLAAEAADPENALLHRMPIRRREAEAIRDTILALSGRLDLTAGGPPVPVHLTPFLEGRGRPGRSGPLDGAGRRSIYVEVRRNFLSPLLLAFDAPVPASTIGRRSASNVPSQALILLNDPFVVEQARLWARRIAAAGARPEEHVAQLYLAAFSRRPTDTESGAALGFLAEQQESFGLPPGAPLTDERAWADLCHVLLNVKELTYVN